MMTTKNGRTVYHLGYGYTEKGEEDTIVRFMQIALKKAGLESLLAGKVVDLGCGDGGILNELSKQYSIEPVGVDLFPKREYSSVAYLEEDILKTSIPDASANLVYCVNVLTALDGSVTPTDLFKEVDRIVAPGGLFIVMNDSDDFVSHTFKSAGYKDYHWSSIAHIFRKNEN